MQGALFSQPADVADGVCHRLGDRHLLGLLIGRYKTVDAATDWLVSALYATPQVAIIPLVILWFGLGNGAKIFIVTVISVFPILINTTAGVRNVPAQLIDVGMAFAASERQIFMKLIVPSALPYVMTGLRLGIGRSIIGMVVAEFFTAITGLGAIIVKYGNQYDTASMFVPIFVLMFLGVVLTARAAPRRGMDRAVEGDGGRLNAAKFRPLARGTSAIEREPSPSRSHDRGRRARRGRTRAFRGTAFSQGKPVNIPNAAGAINLAMQELMKSQGSWRRWA